MMKKEQNRLIAFCKRYSFGFDLWGLILFVTIMLPNVIWACVPQFRARLSAENTSLDVAATVFQVIAVAAMIFLVLKEKQKFRIESPLIVAAGLAQVCYYLAWIFLFCDYVNLAVQLVLAIAPCIALVLFQIYRKNYFALIPTAVFAVLHITSAFLTYL